MPSFLGAAFTSAEDKVMSARAAGAAGAWEAGPRSADNALMNPAGLPTRSGSDLSLNAGTPGLRGSALGAAVLTIPIDESLMLAAAYHGLLQDSALGYAENTASLSAGFEINRWLSAGGRYNWHQVQGGQGTNATGGSLDFGIRGRMGLAARHGLLLGAGVRNATSFWGDRYWTRAMPVNFKGGLGWAWGGSSWVGMEFSRILPSTQALEASTLFRVGAEHRFDSGFSARSGYSSDSGQRWALGAGWEPKGDGLRLHLAFLFAEKGSMSQRLQLDWAFAARSKPTVSVAPLEIRYEEGSKRVKEAKFAVNISEDQKAEAWQLEIRDKDGNVIRIIEGSGTPPGFVSWDGRDSSGGWVDDGDQVSYRLNIKTPDGDASSRPLLAGDLSIGATGLASLAIGAEEGQSSLPALLPVFDDDGKEVDHFMIKMPGASGPTANWKILIKDSQGNVLQAIEGSGELPTDLAWDGKNKEGMRIVDISNLQISLVTIDLSGKVSQIAGTVYSQGGLALDWGEDKETRLVLRIAPLSPGGTAFEMAMSDITLEALPIPKFVPPVAPTPQPTPVVVAVATTVPTHIPSPLPTLLPTRVVLAAATAVPTPRSALGNDDPAPYQVLSSSPQIHVRSRLGEGRMAFAFMPPPLKPSASVSRRPFSPETLKRRKEARAPMVVDVFDLQSAREAQRFKTRIQEAYDRYRGLGFKQLRLTGLILRGEGEGEALSRARAVRMSELLSLLGFRGEFVIWVKGEPGSQKGVRIEVLR